MVNTGKVVFMVLVFILFLPVFTLAGTVELPTTGQALQTHFEEDDPAIAYSGTWNSLVCNPCNNGFLKYSGQTGAKAEFSFYGTGIKWTTAKAPSLGKAKIYFNGVYKGMVDLYSPNVQYPVVLEGKGLPAGNYTLRIEVSGQKNPSSTGYYTLIDSFDVYPDDPIPPAPVISVVNYSSINEADAHFALYDWPPATFAVDYKMYCRKVQKWGNTEYAYPFVDVSENVTGSGALIDFGSTIYGFCDDNMGDSDGVCEEGEAFEYDAFVENNEIQLAYDCYATGVSAYQTEGPASNVVRVVDWIGPRLLEDVMHMAGMLTCPSTGVVASNGIPMDIGSICDNPANPDEITGIVLRYDEEVWKDGAETASNYTFTNLVTGATAAVDPSAGAIYYDPSTRMVLLPLSDTLNWVTEVRGFGIPLIRTGADGILQTSVASGSDDVIPPYIALYGGVIATTASLTGPCVDRGTDSALDTVVSVDDVSFASTIWAGPNGICDSIANSAPSGFTFDDIQVVAVGSYSGVCGRENGLDVSEQGDDIDTAATTGFGFILTGANGICDTLQSAYTTASATQIEPTGLSTGGSAGILPGPDGILQSTTPNSISDDVLESASNSSAVKAQNVKDIAGNVIRITGDEFMAGGEVK
ncbi:MAG TPA: hypothetical protein VFF47_02345 [Nitrospirota bacterium]|nr:hypothetical protein [Nitrospirota bacterium]